MLAAVSAVVVQPSLGPVFTVRNGCDPLAKHLFRIIHQLVAGPENEVFAVAVQQLLEPLFAQPGRRDLRLYVIDQLTRSAGVVADEVPQRLIAGALAVQLGSGKQHALRINVGNIDDQTGRGSADIDVVRGVAGIPDQVAFVENRDDNGQVGGMRRPVIRVVVDHNIALVPFPVIQRILNACQIARDRTDMHRSGFRLAKRVEISVEQPGPQILGFPDDRGERHSKQHVRHFLGNGFDGSADHLKSDRINCLVFLGH